ncbi:MAG TPA: FkbM family methyltransferase [Thermobifida alba]|nr:FkbM family methyltransferase [Thermobifida alba]
MIDTWINNRWRLKLPPHQAEMPRWEWWERDRLAYARAMVRPGDVVWDVGAEEGHMSALFASWGARMVLLEPSPKAWPFVRATFEANGLATPEVCFAGFASDVTDLHPEQLDVDGEIVDGWPRCAYDEGIPEFGFRHLYEARPTTPQIRLDDLDAPAPDIVTIDVEGSEYTVLLGAERILTEVRPSWLVSVHPLYLGDYGHSVENVLTCFADHDYETHRIAIDHEHHYVAKPR